jgi:DNA topoisomerase-3
MATINSVNKTEKSVNPPKLYDLTTLQRESNRYFGYTAQQTLDATQALYEKKLVTYPRTDSQFLTEDMEATALAVIGLITEKLGFEAAPAPDIKRVMNNKKVSDHHAIIPTAELGKQSVQDLPVREKDILRLIAQRLVSSTAQKHCFVETEIIVECAGETFATKGKVITEPRWKCVEDSFRKSLKSKEKEADEAPVFRRSIRDDLSAVQAQLTEHFTSPPKPYSEDSLLSAMETREIRISMRIQRRKALALPQHVPLSLKNW